MGILSLQMDFAGQIGSTPRRGKMLTTDSLATITAAGYLNSYRTIGYSFYPTDFIDVVYGFSAATGSGTNTVVTVSISNGIITLVNYVDPGDVLLPVQANHIAGFNGTTGQIYSPTTASPVTLINNGGLQAGVSGTAGTVTSYPSTAAEGALILAAVSNASGNFNTTISNAAAVAQSQVVSIPDGGAATSNFLLNSGAANTLTDFQQLISVVQGAPFTSAGTWTLTRNAGGNYSYVHTAAANSPIVGWQFQPIIRTTSGKGLKLTSIDVLTTVGTIALTSATPTLYLTNYVAGSAVTATSVPVTGTLTTATGTFNVDTLTVTTPAFDNTTDSVYFLEIAYVCQSTTALAVYGIVLHYSQTIA